jgi:hypothetical protein
MEEKEVRVPVTPEQILTQIEKLRIAFPNKDAFFELLIENIVDVEVTEKELEKAVRNIIVFHSGQLYVSKVIEECREQRKKTIMQQEYLECERQIRQIRLSMNETECSQANRNGSNFDSNSGCGIRTLEG